MAHDPAPLSELLKINDQNVADIDGISDLLQDAPLLKTLAAEFASNGTQHKYLKETSAPVVGFRAINDGRDHGHSNDTKVTVDLALLDCSFHVDSAYADEYRFGKESWIARESQRALQAGFFKAEQQLIYGTGGASADGFTGLADASTIDALADDMVVDAGGAAALSSVYLVRSVDAMTDCTLITGNDGNISVGASYEQMMAGSSTGMFNAYVTPVQAYLGLQIGSIYSIGRIANIAVANPLTDDLIADALAKFPAARPATHLVMDRRSLQQLQASRTATNPTGAPAPFPSSAFNVEIVVTDAITNAETAVV